MIAKRVDGRAEGRFSALARYLLHERGGDERLETAWAANTGFEDIDLAVKEIGATQRLAREGRTDPTYHLIVSFREGERVSPDQLRAIEARFAEALGFGEHQRLAVVHGDTENLHMHIAINRAHPETLKRHTPFRDFYALDATCAALEAEYGLERDNRIEKVVDRDGAIPQRARDMEAHHGVESFASWVQGEPKAALKAVLGNEAATWDDVHRALARFDLEIRPRGAGFIISDREGRYRVRASDVLREASKARLEARFGPLEIAPEKGGDPDSRYIRAPHHAESRKLWQAYNEEKESHAQERREAYAGIREAAHAERAMLKAREVEQRVKIWNDPLLSKAAKARLTQGLTRQRAATRGALARRAQTQRASIRHLHAAVGWTEWLRIRAGRGDAAALSALRRTRGRAQEARPEEIKLTAAPRDVGEAGHTPDHETCPSRRFPPRPAPRPHHVDRRGVAIHRLRGGDALRDDGRTIILEPDPGEGAIRRAFDIVAARGGDAIRIEGPEADRLAIAVFAGEERRPIRFADPALEVARSRAEEKERGASPRLGGGASSGGGASGGGRTLDDERGGGMDHPGSARDPARRDPPDASIPSTRPRSTSSRRPGRPSWMPKPLIRGRDDGMDR